MINMLLRIIKDALESGTYGLDAIKTVVDAVKTKADGELTDLAYAKFNSSTVVPTAGDPKTLTDKNDAGVTPWGDGAEVQIAADSGATKYILQGAQITNISAGDDFEIDVLVNSAVIATGCFGDLEQFVPMTAPLIGTNSDVGAILRSKGSNGKTVDVKLLLTPHS